MKVFVTGADGFIGSHITELLVEQGYDVTCFVYSNDDRGNAKKLPVTRISGDVRDASSVEKAMRGCEIVFHLAAAMNNPTYTNEFFHQVNVEGTRNVMNAALKNNVKKVVHFSSIVTIKEDERVVDETAVHSGNFDGPYARTKYLGEQVALEYAKKGLPVTIVLPTVVFGPRAHAMNGFFKMHLQPRIRLASYTDTRLNLIYVKDVARGAFLAMKYGKVGEKYILGGQEVSLGEFLKLLDKVANVHKPIIYVPKWMINLGSTIITPIAGLLQIPFPLLKPQVHAMKRGSAVNCSKAWRELGLNVRPLEDALRETVRWYKDKGYIRLQE
ncbi:MAG: SDR family NAD(P)-dependent oxidoreductase [Candidatus Woesearchaeota archaeon]